MTPGVLSGLSTLRRYILLTRSLGAVRVAPVTVQLYTDQQGSYLVAACTACDRTWDRLTCGASWSTVMSVIGHGCGDELAGPCPECGQSQLAANRRPPALVRTTDGWICQACGAGRSTAQAAVVSHVLIGGDQ